MGPGVLPDELHHVMGTASLALASAVEFVGVGRVRWALTPHGGWYLLGLSSRLTTGYSLVEQVHDVDLVMTQNRVLDGDNLGWDGGDTLPSRAGFQLRILHMNPKRGNERLKGTLERFDTPEGVFVARGTEVGQICTHHTEPLIGVLIATGDNRKEALEKATWALAETKIEGIETNKDVLFDALSDSDFKEQTHNVHLLNRHLTVPGY
jgi:acetyl/propionyl-CoA carboxylase alpha subunit